MTEPAAPHLVVRQLALPPVRDPDRASDLLADYLHDHPHVTDPDIAASLATGQIDVQLTVHAPDREAAEARADQVLRDALVHAVMTSAAEAIRDERTYRPIGHKTPAGPVAEDAAMSSSRPQADAGTSTSTRHADDLHARIARVLREHEPPTHVDRDGLPPDEFDCCADAVMAVVEPAIRAAQRGEDAER